MLTKIIPYKNQINATNKQTITQKFQEGHDNIQGAPKKMHHSNLYPISVLEVGFYFLHVFFNQNFEPVSLGHSKNAHSESKTQKTHAWMYDFLQIFPQHLLSETGNIVF